MIAWYDQINMLSEREQEQFKKWCNDYLRRFHVRQSHLQMSELQENSGSDERFPSDVKPMPFRVD